jgi:hypothetical protein
MKEALKLALEAMEAETNPSWDCNSYHPKIWNAITTIKEALAQPAQEPVAAMKMLHTYGDTTPQQRPWVGLTAAEVDRCWNMTPMDTRNSRHMFAYSIEAKLKGKNNGT